MFHLSTRDGRRNFRFGPDGVNDRMKIVKPLAQTGSYGNNFRFGPDEVFERVKIVKPVNGGDIVSENKKLTGSVTHVI